MTRYFSHCVFLMIYLNFNKISTANPINSRSSISSLSSSRRRIRSNSEWKQPTDDWNITSIPRSVLPHLVNKNQSHTLPAPANLQYRTIDSDEKVMQRFHEIKVDLKN